MQSGRPSSSISLIAWDRETRSWVGTNQWVWTYDPSVPQGQYSYRGATPIYTGPSRKKDLSALSQRRRGIATYALNAGQGIAGLGDSIPILFGKRTSSSGGLVSVPDAVYMRMHSAGVYEWLRAAFVIGEGGKQLGIPAERGVRLGRKTLDVLDQGYYAFGTTTGATSDNDPTISIGTQGSFKAFSDLTGADEYLGGTINQGEVRCFSQTFSSNESFGFSGEEPDCEAAEFGEISTQSFTSVPLNSVKAFVSNTRSCEVTEIGLAISLNATGPDKDGIAGPGTLWVNQNNGQVIRITSIAAYIANVYPVYFRKDLNLNTQLDGVLARRQQEWDEGRRFYMVLDSSTMIPVDGHIFSSRNFVNQIGSTWFPYTGDNRNRNTASATGYALAVPNPCAVPNFTSILSDPNNPKMAFEIYWRDAKVAGNAWRLLTSKPLIVATADSTTMFSSLKIQHPSLSAVQFKFEAIKPDDFALNHMQYNSALLNNRMSHQAQSRGSFPIIYSRNSSEVFLNQNDGFKLTFRGGLAPFFGDVTIDDQSVNYAVGISYVNEIIQDSPDYPFMSMALLNIRGFKGMTSLGQMSIYYDEGAQIRLLETGADGASNMFPELANYLLTTFPGATAGAVAATAIDTASFLKAITFTRSKGLFFDGVIEDKSGAFEFIANYAPYFLLNFGMKQGKYAFSIATQDSSTGTGTATATQKLTLDDIVADSYQVQYATLQDREEAIVNVTYRFQEQYMLGEPRTVSVAPANYTGSKIVAIDLSDFCTTENHAVTYARFVLASRLKRTHTVNFTTFLGRIDLSPGRLFTFDFTVTASTSKTYKNTSQYQVVSAFYRADGLVDVEAIEMPTNFATLVFGNTYKVVT
jgi:hypothetical protein